MRVIGDKNQISIDVFDFMISYPPFPQKSIRSKLAKPFSMSKLQAKVLQLIAYKTLEKQVASFIQGLANLVSEDWLSW